MKETQEHVWDAFERKSRKVGYHKTSKSTTEMVGFEKKLEMKPKIDENNKEYLVDRFNKIKFIKHLLDKG